MTNSLLYTTFESGVYGGIGYIYAIQTKLPVNLTTSILVLSRVADRVIQELCKSVIETGNRRGDAGKARQSAATYIATNILVNACTIAALNHFNTIALKGTLILSSLAYFNAIRLLSEIA
ncbi:MAG: hypothetical protein H0V82_07955 [Candidatus Protochlamydia sp.]|nr:hypothetical protein [Candidatus Protochlamydia sp.]